MQPRSAKTGYVFDSRRCLQCCSIMKNIRSSNNCCEKKNYKDCPCIEIFCRDCNNYENKLEKPPAVLLSARLRLLALVLFIIL